MYCLRFSNFVSIENAAGKKAPQAHPSTKRADTRIWGELDKRIRNPDIIVRTILSRINRVFPYRSASIPSGIIETSAPAKYAEKIMLCTNGSSERSGRIGTTASESPMITKTER